MPLSLTTRRISRNSSVTAASISSLENCYGEPKNP
jgi:hypothetical protein